MKSTHRSLLSLAGAHVALALMLLVPTALSSTTAHAAQPQDRFQVELRVIEAVPGAGGSPIVDSKLNTLGKDLRNLPFKKFSLLDSHASLVTEGERISLEIPGQTKAGKRRFLVVGAQGRQPGGKLRFQLQIEAMKFDTLVAVPEGGTIIVGGPRGADGNTLIFAFTARTKN